MATVEPNAMLIYLLLDVSDSMAGAPLQALQEVLTIFFHALSESLPVPVYISTVTFSSTVHLLTRLQSSQDGFVPRLKEGGASSLGQALGFLKTLLDEDYRRPTNHPPARILIATDGYASDAWDTPLIALQTHWAKPVSLALACGQEVDNSVLERLGDSVLVVRQVTSDRLMWWIWGM